MQRILNIFGWMLVIASAIVLAAALFLETGFRALQSAVPGGVLLALAGHLFTQAKTLSDSREKESSFNLQAFRDACEHAYALLSDGNNSRAKWIEAARCLAHAEDLANGVSVREHRLLLEVERLKLRGRFHSIISNRKPQFFYGVPELYPTLDEAARASSAREKRNGRVTTNTVCELSEASLKAVWRAAGWPKEYQDPLEERFTDEEISSMEILFPDLHAFLEHHHRWASSSGNLYARK